MSEHKKVICSCGAVISNCRCASPDKNVETIFEGCDLCQERNRAVLDLFENSKIFPEEPL
jgi:hypothetical protein